MTDTDKRGFPYERAINSILLAVITAAVITAASWIVDTRRDLSVVQERVETMRATLQEVRGDLRMSQSAQSKIANSLYELQVILRTSPGRGGYSPGPQ